MPSRGPAYGWLSAAVAVSAALILGAPFIGQLRTAVRDATGTSFVLVLGVTVGAAAAAALLLAVRRITDRRPFRLGALAAAVAVAVAYMLGASTGNREVDAVERFHFLEYGLITVLFYRAWRPADDGAALVMPLIAGLIVGTLEEWLQWFIPVRVGEARDILLNGFAMVSGLLFSLGLDPLPTVPTTLRPASRRAMATSGAAAVILFAGFIHSVHLGHEIRDAEAGVFRSRYSAEELSAIGVARAARWKTEPPLTWSRLSREDQYFTEGVAHVHRRNETWDTGNVLAARHENLILEKYYAPVLDTPSYLSATGLRWPPAQRADAESRVGPGFMIYDSDALDYPVVTWPKWTYWTVAVVLALLVLRSGGTAG